MQPSSIRTDVSSIFIAKWVSFSYLFYPFSITPCSGMEFIFTFLENKTANPTALSQKKNITVRKIF